MGNKVGYIRVSTVEQNDERQLQDVDLDKVFRDKVSAKSTKRDGLQEMLNYIREGDEIIVHDISRLARNLGDLLDLVKTITGKGCTVRFIKENLTFNNDKNDAIGQLMLSMLGSVYQFERSIMLERQREGVQIAKKAGKYKGRKKTVDDNKIIELLNNGLSMRKCAKELGVSLSSVQRAKMAVTV